MNAATNATIVAMIDIFKLMKKAEDDLLDAAQQVGATLKAQTDFVQSLQAEIVLLKAQKEALAKKLNDAILTVEYERERARSAQAAMLGYPCILEKYNYPYNDERYYKDKYYYKNKDFPPYDKYIYKNK